MYTVRSTELLSQDCWGHNLSLWEDMYLTLISRVPGLLAFCSLWTEQFCDWLPNIYEHCSRAANLKVFSKYAFFSVQCAIFQRLQYLGIHHIIPWGYCNMVYNKWCNKHLNGHWQCWELCTLNTYYVRYKNAALGVNVTFFEIIVVAEQGLREYKK